MKKNIKEAGIIKNRTGIIIPSYDRTSDLEPVLENLTKLKGCFDIFVYDDCTPHAGISHLCERFSQVKYRKSPRNLGVIGIRNYAMSELMDNYEFLHHFDDDSYPLNLEHIMLSEEKFDSTPNIAVLSFPILNDLNDTRIYSAGEVFTYVGCGNAWRTSAIPHFGLFSTLFERQGEEMEHSFRVWKSGFTIERVASLPVVHWQSMKNRNFRKISALNSTAYLKWTIINWSGVTLWKEIFRWGVFTIRRANLISWSLWLNDLMHEERGLIAALRQRDPIHKNLSSKIRLLYINYRKSLKQHDHSAS